MPRDDFSSKIKDSLARRVNYHCANPACKTATTGPHAEPDKSVNIGVAAHISAASSGGPRYNASLTPDERSSPDNGIWLCQSCAKLIDSDPKTYSSMILMRWKVTAELRTLRELGGASREPDYFPQPAGAVHAPIPRIGGLRYEEARKLLFDAGWQPEFQHWSRGTKFDMTFGNGLYFWNKGYHEIVNACGTGAAYCTFAFRDLYGNRLIVVTAGEVFEEEGITPGVWSWHFDNSP